MAETKYGGTVTNVKRNEFHVAGAATAKHVRGHVGQPTNYSLMNEVYILLDKKKLISYRYNLVVLVVGAT